jgi:hypothetical protein
MNNAEIRINTVTNQPIRISVAARGKPGVDGADGDGITYLPGNTNLNTIYPTAYDYGNYVIESVGADLAAYNYPNPSTSTYCGNSAFLQLRKVNGQVTQILSADYVTAKVWSRIRYQGNWLAWLLSDALPEATASTLGGIKVGNNLSIDGNGVLSASNSVTVINNLTTGGTAVALSAEMGKTLQSNKVEKVTGKDLSANDFTNTLKNKLDNVADNANNYTHPANHPPSIITQDVDNRFVTDTEKSTWNGKASSTDLAKRSTMIATYEVTGATETEINFTGLDILADGGVYQVIINSGGGTSGTRQYNMWADDGAGNINTTATDYIVGATSGGTGIFIQTATYNNFSADIKVLMMNASTNIHAFTTFATGNTSSSAMAQSRWNFQPATKPTNLTKLMFNELAGNYFPVGFTISVYKMGVL